MTGSNEQPVRFSDITAEQREAAALKYRERVVQPARDELTIRGLDPDTPESETAIFALINTFHDYDPVDNPDLPPVDKESLTMSNVARVVLGEVTDGAETTDDIAGAIFDPLAEETMRTMYQDNVDTANSYLITDINRLR